MKFKPRKAASSVLTEKSTQSGTNREEDKKVEGECRALYILLWPLPIRTQMLRTLQTCAYITHMNTTYVNIMRQEQNILRVKGTEKDFLERNRAPEGTLNDRCMSLLKMFLHSKLFRVKRWSSEWEEIFANYTSDMDLMYKIHKWPGKHQDIQKQKYKWPINIWKGCSISLAITLVKLKSS